MKRVVIVGAGVIGLFCAVRLAKAGARVTLVEAEVEHARGPGASAAAAGMLAPMEPEPSTHEGIAFASLELWRRWREGAQWADGVRFDGGVVVARDAAGAGSIVHHAKRLGRTATQLSPAQFRKRTGLRAMTEHTLFVADEGIADPLRVMSGLAMQARAHGVLVAYGRDAATVSVNTVTTHEGEVYEADAVVIAPGVWASASMLAAAPALKHVRPAKGHLVSVALKRTLAPNLRAPDFYLARRREDVVLGSTMELGRTDRRVNPARVAELLAAAEAVFPGEVRGLDHSWAGIRPMSPDGWPMIGPTADGILVAAGHSRNGWLLAPITAEIISGYVFGAELPPEWAALSPERFEPP